MKTFKLVELTNIRHEGQMIKRENIVLNDGLIINKEDGENHWLIEACVDKQYLPFFEEASAKEQELHLLATISKKSNDPATLFAKVKKITVMEEHLSVLLDGTLVRTKIDMAEVLLEDLIEQGLKGEELLKEFKQKLHEKRSMKV
jgi:putative protein kinase ArgK-like GTPase of G3E family